ncbi:MAG: endolytic transglycosylase MltG, partial [Eubacteriales bacterium]|nr:endolytic transglycosylase MltG [Eubacteriales bacterium]
MDFFEIVEILQSNTESESQIKFLIKEGETQEDIGKNLEKAGIISYNDFMTACNTLSFDYDFLKEMPEKEERTSRLEGYLYPDTYFIKKGESAESIINKLLKRFDQLYTDEMRKATKEKGLTIDEVVTMASIIEKEIKYPPERKIASSVIFNRLEQGMPLQMDATVLYAKKEHSDRTMLEDTKIESPYNTYYVTGLPIGPISNPRIDCIDAVLNPEQTDYIYYVLKDEQTGEHFYTGDYNEFLNAKKEYIKKFD